MMESIDHYRQLLANEPSCFEQVQSVAIAAAKSGDLYASVDLFDLLVEAQPNSFQAWGNRANVLDDLGRTDEALASFDRALQIHPRYEAALANRRIVQQKQGIEWFNKGVLRDSDGDLEAALDCYERACAIDPENSAANLNAALNLEAMGRMDEAIARFIDSARIDPAYVDGLNRAGDILNSGLGRHEEALVCYDRSLAINPDQRGTRWNRSHSLLALGRYAEGWLDYDAKRNMTHGDGTGWIAFQQQQWRGEPISGKRILLWCEQGFGDVFQFCRYVPLVQDLGATVFFMVHKTTERFFKNVFAGTGIEVILGSAQASPYDYQCPLLALPAACKTDSVGSIPSAKPYLQANSEDADRWQNRLSKDFGIGKRRIGMVWASGYRPDNANWQMMDLRSLHLREFALLAGINNAAQTQIFSLQLQEPAAQLLELQSQGWGGPAIVDLGKDIDDWADTAGLVANLDLVITTDTALAHLAAAMGKPTWILLHHSHCWRWLQGRGDSPWYPSVRLFKQTKAGDWKDVVRRVVFALNDEQV
jgi:tetratricopeptide (TPR) repeat protein